MYEIGSDIPHRFQGQHLSVMELVFSDPKEAENCWSEV